MDESSDRGRLAGRGALSRRAGLRIALALLTLASPAATLPLRSATEGEAQCKRLALRPPPRWSISGAWNAPRGELWLVDILDRRILRYHPDGGFVGEVPAPGTDEGGWDHPTELRPLDDGGFVLRNGSTRLLWLDGEGRLTGQLDVQGRAAQLPDRTGTIGGIAELAIRGGTIFALVPLEVDGKVLYAQSTLARDDVEPAVSALLPEYGRTEERFASLTTPLMATAAGDVYWLSAFGGEFRIERVSGPRQRLGAFPLEVAKVPTFPSAVGPEAAVEEFSFLETSRLPLQLYGRGEHLYLLTREPSPMGTVWRVHQIDPKADRLVRSVRLPTRANHVYLVPGPEHWAVIEKGAVTAPGRMAIPSALLLPTAWVEETHSSVLGKEDQALQCPPSRAQDAVEPQTRR